MAKTLEDCRKGEHELQEIHRTTINCITDEDEVVRWCSICGAVVVDLDYDNRTIPGRVMKMRLPNVILSKS